jgi:hypothetical protein
MQRHGRVKVTFRVIPITYANVVVLDLRVWDFGVLQDQQHCAVSNITSISSSVPAGTWYFPHHSCSLGVWHQSVLDSLQQLKGTESESFLAKHHGAFLESFS